MADIEPLEPAVWFGAIKKLAVRQAAMMEEDLERLLRHAYHLVQLTPRPLRDTIRTELSETRFEELLQCEAFESAAIGLVGPLSFDVSASESELVEAQVRLPDQVETIPVRSSNFASAMLGAWAQCLIALEARSLKPHAENLHPAPNKARSERHLRLIEH